MDAFEIRDACVAALAVVDARVTTREADDIDGPVEPTVILSVTPGVASARRAAGGSVRRDSYVNALAVANTKDGALWLAHGVREALVDLDLGSPHGRLTDASYDGEPVPEPDTSPALWSRALAFTITTKRSSR